MNPANSERIIFGWQNWRIGPYVEKYPVGTLMTGVGEAALAGFLLDKSGLAALSIAGISMLTLSLAVSSIELDVINRERNTDTDPRQIE